MRHHTRTRYTVEQYTQHWRVIGGRVYRDAIVRVDGERRLYSLPEPKLGDL